MKFKTPITPKAYQHIVYSSQTDFTMLDIFVGILLEIMPVCGRVCITPYTFVIFAHVPACFSAPIVME